MKHNTKFPLIAALSIVSGGGYLPMSFYVLTIPNSDSMERMIGWGLAMAGGALIGFGIIYLAVLHRSDSTFRSAYHATGILCGFLPVTVAFLTIPFGLLLPPLSEFLFRIVLLICAIWSVLQSTWVANRLSLLIGRRAWWLIFSLMLTLQFLLIHLSFFYFDFVRDRLLGIGVRYGFC